MSNQFISAEQSYAQRVNSRYSNKESHYFDAKDRLESSISGNFTRKQSLLAAINLACDAFVKNNPTKTKMEDLSLAESICLPLSDILIDATMQRMLILPWVLDIVKNWRDVQCQPIQVYPVKDSNKLKYYPAGQKGLYASWDGQHTLMALYILCVYVFKQDPAKVMVPVNIYRMESKAEIRETFVSGNSSSGKRLLDSIDLYQQQIYGVRIDGSKKREWLDADLKQQYLEQADLFATAEKFGDTKVEGAISRMQEIGGYTPDIIQKFCLYAATVMIQERRPVASQEIEIMCAWFDMAKKDGIEYTDQQVVSLAQHLNELFGANFHEASPFWNKVQTAYKNWWTKYWEGVDEEYRPERLSFSKNWRNGGTFLWHQLKKTWNGPVPALNINTPFKPYAKDLYDVKS